VVEVDGATLANGKCPKQNRALGGHEDIHLEMPKAGGDVRVWVGFAPRYGQTYVTEPVILKGACLGGERSRCQVLLCLTCCTYFTPVPPQLLQPERSTGRLQPHTKEHSRHSNSHKSQDTRSHRFCSCFSSRCWPPPSSTLHRPVDRPIGHLRGLPFCVAPADTTAHNSHALHHELTQCFLPGYRHPNKKQHSVGSTA
jgi:hypothetical protein